MFLKRIQYTISRGIKGNLDLLILWVLLIAIQPLISVEHLLARPDLVPWLMFGLAGAVVLRGRRYGDGPHTSLTKRHSFMGLILTKVGMVATLISLVWWYDLGVAWDVVRTQSVGWLDLVVRPIGITVVTLIAIRLSKSHQQTAWNPHGISSAFIWMLGVLLVAGAALAIGFWITNAVHHYFWICKCCIPLFLELPMRRASMGA